MSRKYQSVHISLKFKNRQKAGADSVEARWGLGEGGLVHARFCPMFHFHRKFWINLINFEHFPLYFSWTSILLPVNVCKIAGWVAKSVNSDQTSRSMVYYYYFFICWTLEGGSSVAITKTCLYNFDPLKPHFYIVKLGFTEVYIIFLIFFFLTSAQNIDCLYSLKSPRRGGSNEYPQYMFWAEIWKIAEIFIWFFSVFGFEIFF